MTCNARAAVTSTSGCTLRLAAALLVAGCSSSTAPPDVVAEHDPCHEYACPGDPSGTVAAGAATLRLGTGDACFEQADDGVVIFGGPQGGFHIWLAARVSGVANRVLLEHAVRDADSGETLSLGDPIQLYADLCPVPGEWLERDGVYGYLATTEPEAEIGREVTLWMRISDDALQIEDEVTTTIVEVVPWR